jgi:ubiquinone/menaquinone biosynthesis C-methylase UbiE/uncharacterized protein YbaR (Trm112 family)
MEVYKNIQKIKELYDKGENIIQYFRNSNNTDLNSLESILISYDFQSGTYTKQLKQSQEFNTKYTALIAEIIDNLTQKSTYIIMEAGVGEATTLGNVVKKLINSPVKFFGFDLSLSRLLYANKFLKSIDLSNYLVFTGNLFNIPVLSNSVNVVYTSHSIEPNGGKEKEALSELYRITKNYLVLFEPCYELASDEAKQRMERNGYVKNLKKHAEELGYKVLKHELLPLSINPLNPTALLLIEKSAEFGHTDTTIIACPITTTALTDKTSYYFAKESYLAYPIIENIPCLLPQNAILGSHIDIINSNDGI